MVVCKNEIPKKYSFHNSLYYVYRLSSVTILQSLRPRFLKKQKKYIYYVQAKLFPLGIIYLKVCVNVRKTKNLL